MDELIWIPCSECDYGTEVLEDMVQHAMDDHNYSPEEAQHYAQLWQEGAYEAEELRNIERAEHFRRYGVDPEAEWDDHMPGK